MKITVMWANGPIKHFIESKRYVHNNIIIIPLKIKEGKTKSRKHVNSYYFTKNF